MGAPRKSCQRGRCKKKKKEKVMLMLCDIVFCTLRMLYIAVYKLTPNIRRPLACRTGEENYVEMGVAGNT